MPDPLTLDDVMSGPEQDAQKVPALADLLNKAKAANATANIAKLAQPTNQAIQQQTPGAAPIQQMSPQQQQQMMRQLQGAKNQQQNQAMAIQRAQMEAQAQRAGAIAEHPVLGTIFNEAGALTTGAAQGVGEIRGGLAGPTNEQAGKNVNAEAQGLGITQPIVPQAGTGVLNAVGQMAPAAATSLIPGVGVPLTAAMIAAQTGGAAKGEVAGRREAGENITPEQEQEEVARKSVLAGTGGLAAGPAAKAIEGLLPEATTLAGRLATKAAGGVGATAAGAGVQGNPLSLQDVLTGAVQGASGAGGEHEVNRTQNAEPEAPTTHGTPEAGKTQENRFGGYSLKDIMAQSAKTEELSKGIKELSAKQDEQLAAHNNPLNVKAAGVQANATPDAFAQVEANRANRAPLNRNRGMVTLPFGRGEPTAKPEAEEEGPFSTKLREPVAPDTTTISRWQGQQKEAPVNPLAPAQMRRRGMVQWGFGKEAEDEAARQNPETVSKTGFHPATEEGAEATRSKAIDKMNMQELQQEVQRLRGIKPVPGINPAGTEGLTQHYHQGENWRQNVAEHDLASEPPHEYKGGPDPYEQQKAFEAPMKEDLGNRNPTEPEAPAPYSALPRPPVEARAWSPDEIRSWAEHAGHDISSLPPKSTRNELLSYISDQAGKISNPEGANIANPHTNPEAATRFLKINGIDNPTDAQVRAMSAAKEPSEGLQKARILESTATKPGTHLEELKKPSFLERNKQGVQNMMDSLFHPHATNALTRVKGAAEADEMMLANKTKDFLSAAKGLSEQDYERFHDSVDKTGESVVPGMQKHVEEIIKPINDYFSKRYSKLGVDTSANRAGYMSYNFAKPEGMSEGNYQKKIGAVENHLKERGNYSYGEAKQAAEHLGLKSLPQGEGQVKTWAAMSHALAFRDMLKEEGTVIGKDDALPAGKSELPDKLANDPAFLDAVSGDTNHGQKRMVVDSGMRAAMDNLLNESDNGTLARSMISGANKIKFLADTAYAPRAAVAALADNMAGNFHGVTEGVMAHLGKLNPEQNGVLQYAMKQGLRSEFLPSLRDLNKPESLAGKLAHAGKTALSAPRIAADTAKISGVMEGTRQILGRDDLSADQKQEKVRNLVSALNETYGMANKASTLPPVLMAAKNIVTPTLSYFTSGARLAGKATIGNGQAFKVLAGGLAAALAGNGALTYAMTGQKPTGEDWLRFRTGGKNNDGTDKRAGFTSFVAPLITAFSAFKHSPTTEDAIGNIANSTVNPAVKGIAQALLNRDYHGNPIGDYGARAEYALQQLAPLMPSESRFWETDQQKQQESDLNTPEQIAGMRSAPRWSEESKASNLMQDFENARRGPAAQSDDPAAFQKSQWRSDLYQNWDGKSDFRSDPKIADTIGQMKQAVANGTLTGEAAKDLLKEVKGRIAQPGLEGVGNSGLPPQELLQVWKQATPQEQESMRPSILQKIGKLKRSTATNLQDWKALRDAVK